MLAFTLISHHITRLVAARDCLTIRCSRHQSFLVMPYFLAVTGSRVPDGLSAPIGAVRPTCSTMLISDSEPAKRLQRQRIKDQTTSALLNQPRRNHAARVSRFTNAEIRCRRNSLRALSSEVM
jgi:hypothetical protein